MDQEGRREDITYQRLLYKQVTCPLCGNDNACDVFQLQRRGYRLFIKKCITCKAVYQNPRLSNIESLYSEDYFEGRSEFTYNIDDVIFLPIFETRLKFLQNYMNLDFAGKLLDVGCAKGTLLTAANHLGWECWGTDVSSYAIETVKNRIPGVHLLKGEVANINLPENYFKVVTMFEVIEHFTDPISDLKAINRSLCEDGVMVIQTANFSSLRSILSKRNYYYFEPGHLTYFTPPTLKHLLEATGFRIERFWAGSELPLVSELKVMSHLISPYWLMFKKLFNKVRFRGWTANSVIVVYARKRKHVVN